MKKVKINKEKCIGCGTCAALAPEVFEIGSDFKAFIKEGASFDGVDLDDIVASCPVEAIEVEGE